MTITSIDRSGNTLKFGATQTLDDNTSLTISGVGNVANIKVVLSVNVFPKNDLTITLDLDKTSEVTLDWADDFTITYTKQLGAN